MFLERSETSCHPCSTRVPTSHLGYFASTGCPWDDCGQLSDPVISKMEAIQVLSTFPSYPQSHEPLSTAICADKPVRGIPWATDAGASQPIGFSMSIAPFQINFFKDPLDICLFLSFTRRVISQFVVPKNRRFHSLPAIS